MIETLRSQRHASVDEADGGDHLFLIDQLLRHLHAALVLGFVVALDQLQRPSEHAAGSIDFGHGELDAIAHGYAHGGRTTGKRAGYADLDRIGRVRGKR